MPLSHKKPGSEIERRPAIRAAKSTSTDVFSLNAAFCCLAAFASPVLSERKLVGAVGIEPTTFGLKGRCSTTELRP